MIAQVLLAALALAGCTTVSAKSNQIRVAGAVDVLPLASASQAAFTQASGYSMTFSTPENSLDDLRKGKVDVVLAGRELYPAEMEGLSKMTIAYDAVCLIINTRTYKGGLLQTPFSDLGGMVIPQAKFSGVRNFSLSDVKNLMGNILQKNKTHWFVPGSFFTFEPYFNGNKPEVDPKDPTKALGTWTWNAIDFSVENLQPGKFDTQVVILDKAGYPVSDLNNRNLSFAPRIFQSEEELISARFEYGLSDTLKADVSTYQFHFPLLIASRRVTLRALQHDFYVSALSVDNVDPLDDPQAIYSGRYPLSRKIYMVMRSQPGDEVKALEDFLLSEQGQGWIEKAFFLPLPQH